MIRFAPTPSGFLHKGNILNALLIKELAERNNWNILLRIDDLDRGRFRQIYLERILNDLSAIGFNWQKGPKSIVDFSTKWCQESRTPLYATVFAALKKDQLLFPCSCSRKEIQERTGSTNYDGYCLRHKPNTSEKLNYRVNTKEFVPSGYGKLQDAVHKYSPYFVVWKKDGLPSYHLCSVCDDLFFGVSHVVRGQDLYPSTLIQFYLALCLPQLQGYAQVQIMHHPLLTDANGLKMSKSTQGGFPQGVDSYNLPELKQLADQYANELTFYNLQYFASL